MQPLHSMLHIKIQYEDILMTGNRRQNDANQAVTSAGEHYVKSKPG